MTGGVWRYAGTFKSQSQLLPLCTRAVLPFRNEVCDDTECVWLLSKYAGFPARLLPLFWIARLTLWVVRLSYCINWTLCFLSESWLSNSVRTSFVTNIDVSTLCLRRLEKEFWKVLVPSYLAACLEQFDTHWTDFRTMWYCAWKDNIKMDLQEVGWTGMDCIGLAQKRNRCRALVNEVMNLRVP
jgi:hypothetical protein